LRISRTALGTYIVVPLTSKHLPALTFVKIEPSEVDRLTTTNWAITNQIYTLGEGDLIEHLGKVGRSELLIVKDALKKVFAIS